MSLMAAEALSTISLVISTFEISMTKPTKKPEPTEPLPDAEEVLRRLLNTPPEPFTPGKKDEEEKPKKVK